MKTSMIWILCLACICRAEDTVLVIVTPPDHHRAGFFVGGAPSKGLGADQGRIRVGQTRWETNRVVYLPANSFADTQGALRDPIRMFGSRGIDITAELQRLEGMGNQYQGGDWRFVRTTVHAVVPGQGLLLAPGGSVLLRNFPGYESLQKGDVVRCLARAGSAKAIQIGRRQIPSEKVLDYGTQPTPKQVADLARLRAKK